ncbi:3'-5' exonuclease [Xylographa carneopallida]|nr:3'-5' exonuclease [Xylographa carneopallida]
MSCSDVDDMFPSHDRAAFDPCSVFDKGNEQYDDEVASTTAAEALESRLSTPSPSCTPPLSVNLPPCASKQSPSPQRPSSPHSSSSCSHSGVLLSHAEAIAHLQQDVFALRHLMESEVSRMKQEMKVSMAAMEVRMMEVCKKAAAASPPANPTTAPTGPLTAQPTVTAVPAVLSPRETAANVRRSVWGGDFMDSECGDDCTASHPSQFEEKEQELINAVMKEKLALDDKDAAAALHEKLAVAEKDSKSTSAAASTAPSTTPAKSSSASATALSITSLTALINPSGLPLTEAQLISLACRILADHGSVPVGKMGSLLHKAANDHTLPALLKERYGGLKKFLQAQSKYFMLGDDHPYNPHVALVGQQQLPVLPAAAAHTSQPSSASAHCATSSNPSSASPLALAMTDSRSFGMSHSHDVYGSQPRGHAVGSYSAVEYGRSTECDDRDSLYTSYHAAQRRASPSGVSTPSTARGTPFSASSMPSYTSRLQEALQQASTPAYCSPSDMHSLSQQMDSLLTDVVSLDCEMVGCGIDGSRSVLARASIVNYHGSTLYDCFVQPPDGEIVADYRTHVSGIRPGDLDSPRAIQFVKAQEEVADLLKGRIIVAHSVVSDLQALRISHPPHLIRDTAHFPLLCPDRPRSLRALVVDRLGWIDFQQGEHDSVEDARAVMRLYRSVEDEWEAVLKAELAAEEREKKVLAAKSAANARHRALLLDQQQHQQQQQQQQHGYSAFGPSQLHKGSYLPSPSLGNGAGYIGSGGQSFGNKALLSGHTIHSTLWK